MSTIEAIQIYLNKFGWILFPWNADDDPPGFITEETVFDLTPRVFENRNDGAPSHFYVHNRMRAQWEFERSEGV